MEWVLHMLQETRRKYHPLPKQEHLPTPLPLSRNVEPLGSVLCISATIGPIAQSLPSASLQAELLSTNSGPDFLEGQWGTKKEKRDICFISGQSRRCDINTESLSF